MPKHPPQCSSQPPCAAMMHQAVLQPSGRRAFEGEGGGQSHPILPTGMRNATHKRQPAAVEHSKTTATAEKQDVPHRAHQKKGTKRKNKRKDNTQTDHAGDNREAPQRREPRKLHTCLGNTRKRWAATVSAKKPPWHPAQPTPQPAGLPPTRSGHVCVGTDHYDTKHATHHGIPRGEASTGRRGSNSSPQPASPAVALTTVGAPRHSARIRCLPQAPLHPRPPPSLHRPSQPPPLPSRPTCPP